jgi:hypothetical protein
MIQIYIHKDYNGDSFANDIAVLVLEEDVNVVADFALWHGGPGAESYPNLAAGIDLVVAGWGALNSGGAAADALMAVDVQTWTNEQCMGQSPNQYSEGQIDGSMLCAGDPYPGCTPDDDGDCVDSCQGQYKTTDKRKD